MEFVALSGLPRTGSTVLAAILYQNPKIHTEGHSPICQLIWDIHRSFDNEYCYRAFLGNNKTNLFKKIIMSNIETYYENTNRPIIIDKCRSWTIPENVEVIKKYIRKDPKIIVMERDIEEIINSFLNYAKKQNLDIEKFKEALFVENSEPLTRPLIGYNYAKNNNNGEYFFINYENLISKPKKTLDDLYDFCGWKKFEHNFEKIKPGNLENDEALGHPGLHEIREKLEKREYFI